MEGGMGFKNLNWFNHAMLAKKGWRIMKNPNSLNIARLYKAVCPSSPPPRDAPTEVVELIDPYTMKWDVEKLNQWFTSTDRDLILSIPLSHRAWNDNYTGYIGYMTCLMCDNDVENGVHLFTQCPYTREVWEAANISLPTLAISDLKDGLLELSRVLNKEQFAQALMLTWSMWTNRNSQLWEGKKHHPTEAALLAMSWFNEFSKANDKGTTPRAQRKEWSTLADDWLKCNSDGSFLASCNRGGSGVVFRDTTRAFKVAAMRQFDQGTVVLCRRCKSPFHAELLAVHEGMKLAQSMNYVKVEFETDCMMLVQALNQDTIDCSIMGFLLEDVRELMRANSHYKIMYAPREANKIADKLASQALCTTDSQVWFVIAPEFIKDANECTR
ncbi:uncharacterized protein LOC133730525 [Rosa rugosa]|uniref:uncharacterized protein LOC133730525 n=1 Tax=Rosa rugosa TaxID=74645 RepID=UPI002B407AF3|nr:uncharacterized protein LOC133730525 [Rosa rugosa]